MEPGDILYIPPGFPHEGYSLENSMNYSVGYRAPSGRELISGFADYVLQRELGSQRYTDPDVPSREHPADVLPQELDGLRQMMLDLIISQSISMSGSVSLLPSRDMSWTSPHLSRPTSLMRFTMP